MPSTEWNERVMGYPEPAYECPATVEVIASCASDLANRVAEGRRLSDRGREAVLEAILLAIGGGRDDARR